MGRERERERAAHVKLLLAVGLTWADADLGGRSLHRPTAGVRWRSFIDGHKARSRDERSGYQKAIGVQKAATGAGGVAITEHLDTVGHIHSAQVGVVARVSVACRTVYRVGRLLRLRVEPETRARRLRHNTFLLGHPREDKICGEKEEPDTHPHSCAGAGAAGAKKQKEK